MHAQKSLVFIFLCVVLPFCGVFAQAGKDVIVMRGDFATRLIGKEVDYFEDSSAALSIADIQQPAAQYKFRRYNRDVFVHATKPVYTWFKITVQNLTGSELALETGGVASCWYIDFYRPDSFGKYGDAVKTGALRPEKNKEFPVNFFWLRLAAPSDTAVKTYYLRIISGSYPEYPLRVGTLAALGKHKEESDYLTGGFVGIMLMMVFYNIFLYMATRDSIYVAYVVYLLCALTSVCFLNNYSVLPYNAWLSTHFYVWANSCVLAICFFTSKYLGLYKNHPWLFWVIWVQGAILGIIIPLLNMFLPLTSLIAFTHPAFSFFYGTFVLAGVYLYAKGGSIARYYFFGWVCAAASMVIFRLAMYGVLPYSFLLRNATYFGISLEALMFSFALGERLNTLRAEKEMAREEAIRLSLAQKQELEEKVAERTAALEEQSKRLEEANVAKNKLFSIVSHDLRSPVASLGSMMELLSSGLLTPDELLSYAPQMQKNFENVKDMLEGLLLWSFSQMGGVKSLPVTINLHEKTNSVISLVSDAAELKDIHIKNEIPSTCLAWADANQVKLVLRNLINNAIKFTSAGSVTISAQEQGGIVHVTVSDTGVGMTTEDSAKLFKAAGFSKAGTTGEKGVGLGLMLCKEMIERNGGSIWAESVPGLGSTFHFTLPISNNTALPSS